MLAALAISHWIEHTTNWSIKKFLKTLRRYRTIEIQAGDHAITAADLSAPESTSTQVNHQQQHLTARRRA